MTGDVCGTFYAVVFTMALGHVNVGCGFVQGYDSRWLAGEEARRLSIAELSTPAMHICI